MNKTVKEIVESFLKENGYDGLYNTEGECGCKLDDLFSCYSEGIEDCIAGYFQKLTSDEVEEFEFFIGPTKNGTREIEE